MNQATPDSENPVNTVDGGPLQTGTGAGKLLLPSAQPYASSPVCLVPPSAGVPPSDSSADALAAECLLSVDLQVGLEVDRLDVDALTFDIALIQYQIGTNEFVVVTNLVEGTNVVVGGHQLLFCTADPGCS